jgi:hypothetical protein
MAEGDCLRNNRIQSSGVEENSMSMNLIRSPYPEAASGGIVPAVVGRPLLYTGNGSTQSISGADFSPDLVFFKRRDGGAGGATNPWIDNVRGVGLELDSASTTNESSNATGLTSFDANGFSLGASNVVNASGATFIAWLLQKVASAFDIIGYTGTGAAHAENHNLGVVPELIIVKTRSLGGQGWVVYAAPLSSPATKVLQLNTNGTPVSNSAFWNNTAPTSTEFTVGTANQTNANGGTYIAYLLASLNPGVSIGSYTGDGATNGPAVTTGFKPKFVIIKRTDASGNWIIFDDQRDPTSPHNTYSHVNLAGAAADSVTANSAGGVDFQATGFQSIDANDANINISGATYLYIAIA